MLYFEIHGDIITVLLFLQTMILQAISLANLMYYLPYAAGARHFNHLRLIK